VEITLPSNSNHFRYGTPEIAQPLQSIIDIEKSRLPSHRIISDPSVTMESERQRIGEVLIPAALTADSVGLCK
jgi:hypothetical protein